MECCRSGCSSFETLRSQQGPDPKVKPHMQKTRARVCLSLSCHHGGNILQIWCALHKVAEEERWVLSHAHVNRDDGHILKLQHVCYCFKLNEKVHVCVWGVKALQASDYPIWISHKQFCSVCCRTGLILHRCCLLLPRAWRMSVFLSVVELESCCNILISTHVRSVTLLSMKTLQLQLSFLNGLLS